MLSAIIFDLDGVLADSEPWWNQIDAKLLADYGATYRGEYHQNVVGVNYGRRVGATIPGSTSADRILRGHRYRRRS